MNEPPLHNEQNAPVEPAGWLGAVKQTALGQWLYTYRGTLLIGLMFLIGAGWVLWQGSFALPRSASATTQPPEDANTLMKLDLMRVDAAIGPAREERREKVFHSLLQDLRRRHIRLSALGKDPFGAYYQEKDPTEIARTQPAEEPAPEPVAAPPVDQLTLQSILLGHVPTAVINGMLVQEGQVIAEWTVDQILQDEVVLRWRDQTHRLKMLADDRNPAAGENG